MIPKPLAIGLAIVGTTVAGLLLFSLASEQPEYLTSYVLLIVLSAVIGIPASRILSGESPWYMPHAIMLGTLFLYYVLGTTAMVYYRVPSYFTMKPVEPTALNWAIFAIILTTVCYLIGYRFGPKPKVLPARIEWFFTDTREVQSWFDTGAILGYGIGIAAWIYMFTLGGGVSAHMQNLGSGRGEMIAGAGGFVWHLAQFSYAASLLYFSRRGINPVSIGMLVTLWMILLIYNSRNLVGMHVLATLIIYRVRVGKIQPLVMVGAIMSLFMMLAFLGILRRVGGDISTAMHTYSRTNETLQGRVLSIAGDFTFIRNLADIIPNIGADGRVDYQLGMTYSAFLLIIPGVIWRGQYEFVRAGNHVYLEAFVPDRAGAVSLSNNMITEFYLNFGWAGLVVGGLVVGVALGAVESILMNPHRRYQSAPVVLGALLSCLILVILKSGMHTLINMVYWTAPLLIVYWPNIRFLTNPAPLPDQIGALQR